MSFGSGEPYNPLGGAATERGALVWVNLLLDRGGRSVHAFVGYWCSQRRRPCYLSIWTFSGHVVMELAIFAQTLHEKALAACRTERDRDDGRNELHDHIGGEFGFTEARQAFCSGGAYLQLGNVSRALEGGCPARRGTLVAVQCLIRRHPPWWV